MVYELKVKRVRRSIDRDNTAILTGPTDAAKCLSPLFQGEGREVFMMLALDSTNRVIGVSTIAIGSLSSVEVHPREVFQPAILAGAATIIVAHNHPSGSVVPSLSDRELTKRLVQVGDLLGIPVVDHLILSDTDYNSLANLGYI